MPALKQPDKDYKSLKSVFETVLKHEILVSSEINKLVEIIELDNHPFYIGTQFHPELKSTVENPHPLFVSFIGAALEHKMKLIGNIKIKEKKDNTLQVENSN